MKNKILAFLKKNIKYVLIIGAVLLFFFWYNFKQGQIRRLTEKITIIEMSNFALNNDRQTLEIKIKLLQRDYSVIEVRNDSLKQVLNKYQLQLISLKKKHEQEIAELLKIPNDTVFVRLQPLFPNYDNTPLQYPFSGSQIKQIYKGALSFNMLTQEYSVLDKSFKSCLTLNDNFEIGISNLNKQVSVLQDNIGKADLQIANYQKEVKILNKQVSKKSFWNKTFMSAGAIAVLISVIK